MTPSEYSNHPIRGLLDRLHIVLHSIELTDPDLQSSEENSDALLLISNMAGLTRTLLQSTPAQLVSGYGLGQLLGSFQTVYNELTAYQSNKNVGHIQNAKVQVEQATMAQLWAFAPTVKESAGIYASEIIDKISQTASESIQQLLSRRDEFLENANALSQQVALAQSRLETLVETVVQQKAEATAVTAIVQKEFAEKEAVRASTFETSIKQFQEQFNTTNANSELAQSEYLESLRRSKEQAAQIVQVVGNIGVTGNYQNIANSEATNANIWRRITIGFFGFGIGLAALTFYKFWDQPFSPENAWSALIRLIYALAITAPAWYAARESARHRTNSDRARQTELELASLGPFIELMPDEKKQQIREELTKQYFGKPVSEHTASPPINFKDLSSFLIDFAKTLKK